MREYGRAYRRRPENRERLRVMCRNIKLRAKYGIEQSDVERMLRGQHGRCALCVQPLHIEQVHVDHDHATGCVRGLLCKLCNTALGAFKDRVDTLQRAIRYLSGSKDKTAELAALAKGAL